MCVRVFFFVQQRLFWVCFSYFVFELNCASMIRFQKEEKKKSSKKGLNLILCNCREKRWFFSPVFRLAEEQRRKKPLIHPSTESFYSSAMCAHTLLDHLASTC